MWSAPMTESKRAGSPIGDALVWAYRIIAVAVAMFLPAVAGRWLDARAGSSVFGITGLVIGVAGGLATLVRTARAPLPRKVPRPER